MGTSGLVCEPHTQISGSIDWGTGRGLLVCGHSLILCGSASLGSCVDITAIRGPERMLLNWTWVLRKHTQRPVGRMAVRRLKGGW